MERQRKLKVSKKLWFKHSIFLTNQIKAGLSPAFFMPILFIAKAHLLFFPTPFL